MNLNFVFLVVLGIEPRVLHISLSHVYQSQI
jgi:hypothetical protein